LGGENSGLPFFGFVDAKGALIVNSKQENGGNIGHPFAPPEIAWFLKMLEKAAPRMTPAETGTIERWLKNQKR
jgi:hypothetical protein